MVETAEVIKSEGDNSLLIWKSPVEDFNTGTQLIVHESQEAIFFLNGQALDLFSAGRHTLTTQNVPLLKKILNKATSDKSPFHCEIYFINKVNLPNVPWGIGDVEYMDPEFNFPLKIGASGSMVLRVDDSRKLLLKFVGTEYQLTVDSFTIKMKDFVKMKAKAYLAKFMPEQHINIFEVDQKLDEIAGGLQGLLQSDFDDYGVDLDTLLVTTIKKPEEDPQYKRFMSLYREQYLKIQEAELERRAAEVEAEKRKMQEVKAAEARAEARKIEGWDIQQEHAFGVAEKVAENEGVGNFSGMGMGMA
ncbi:MAG: SPFH domain-containing protein [Coriobacteriia bacterium]|nr:SPFH domain-containing protein [Coriobacteriia bacterium]